MIVLVVVLAVLVVALVVALALARSNLSAGRAQIETLTNRLDEATTEAERAAADASEARARADAEHQRVVDAEQARDELAARLAEAEQATADAEAQTTAARADAAAARVAEQRGLDAMGLWALDTLRLDRLWRDQVAPGGTETSPLATSSDPARAAVDILADVVREGSGTPIELAWHLTEPLPPVPAARLVRTVEELLAAARATDRCVVGVEPVASADDADESAGIAVPGPAVRVRVSTEPALRPPDHVLAALAAAGLTVHVDEAGAVVALIPIGPDPVGWAES